MQLLPLLLTSSIVLAQRPEQTSLLAAVPDDAFSLVHVLDPGALRARAERNDWIDIYGSPDGETALTELARTYEVATGARFGGLLDVALELDGETLLFFTADVAGFLTEPPADRGALANVLGGWLAEDSSRTLDVAGGSVQLGAWPKVPGAPAHRAGSVLALLDHPRALGLYSGASEEAVLAVISDSLRGLVAGQRRAPVVTGFLAEGGCTTGGLEAFVDFTPFVARAEEGLREAVRGVIPDPTGLLGLERGTHLFVTADVSPGTRVEVRAQLRVPEETLAAQLADTFEPLPRTLPPDLPRGAWLAYALDWNLSRFYATARGALEQRDEHGMLLVDQGLAAAETLSGVDPIEDVIDQLTGMFTLYHVQDPDASVEIGELGFGFLAGLVDGERFLEAFERWLGEDGIGVNAVELEGAETYLFDAGTPAQGDDSTTPHIDGGFSVLPTRLVASPGRDTLVRTLRALGRVDDAGLGWDSQLQAAFDENAGAFWFAYIELAPLRAAALMSADKTAPAKDDPFLDSQLILAAHRTAQGMELVVYTR